MNSISAQTSLKCTVWIWSHGCLLVSTSLLNYLPSQWLLSFCQIYTALSVFIALWLLVTRALPQIALYCCGYSVIVSYASSDINCACFTSASPGSHSQTSSPYRGTSSAPASSHRHERWDGENMSDFYFHFLNHIPNIRLTSRKHGSFWFDLEEPILWGSALKIYMDIMV